SLSRVSIRRPPISTLFPCTTLFRSGADLDMAVRDRDPAQLLDPADMDHRIERAMPLRHPQADIGAAGKDTGIRIAQQQIGQIVRSEEHTSELQSRENLVCRLLLEKK